MGTPEVRLRPARLGDVLSCVDVFYEASEELNARTGQPIMPRNPAGLTRLVEHLLRTDPELSFVADDGSGGIVGFGQAHRRGGTWFLAFLFVRPGHQGQRIGRRMLEACLRGGPIASAQQRPVALAVCIEAIQPVSTALYADFGMLPSVPIYALTGELKPDRTPPPEPRLVAVPFAELVAAGADALADEIDAVDRDAVGYAHQQDHALWTAIDRQGYLFREAAEGRVAGYGYVHRSGRIGPVAVVADAWLPEAIEHLMSSVPVPDAWLAFVPGPSTALVPLLRAGLRVDGPPALYCATGGGPAFSRYLPGNFAIV